MVRLVFSKVNKLKYEFESLPQRIKPYLTYVCPSACTDSQRATYYNHIFKRDSLIGTYVSHELGTIFTTSKYFSNYNGIYSKHEIISTGWKHASITLTNCELYHTGYLRCPLMALKYIIKSAGISSCIIPFKRTTDAQGNRTYSRSWSSTFYDIYCRERHHRNVIFVHFYSDATKLFEIRYAISECSEKYFLKHCRLHRALVNSPNRAFSTEDTT